MGFPDTDAAETVCAGPRIAIVISKISSFRGVSRKAGQRFALKSGRHPDGRLPHWGTDACADHPVFFKIGCERNGVV
jgi:hypothetical protein